MDLNNIRIAGQTALSIYDTMPGKIVLLALALLFCFAGYKLLSGVCALVGVVLGVACGTCITSLFASSMTEIMNLILTVLAMVVLGIVCGIICFKFYHLAVFFIFAAVGAGIVYLPALFIAEHSKIAFWIVLAACAVLFGVTSVLFLRPVCIVTTSLFGFAAAFPLFVLLNQSSFWGTIGTGVGLTVAGCIFQLLTNRKSNIHQQSPSKNQIPEEEAADEGQPVNDSTQVIDLSAVPQEEPDEIDTISDLVAAHIGMTQPIDQSEEQMTRPLGHLADNDTEKIPDSTAAASSDGMKKETSQPNRPQEPARKTKRRNPLGILLSLVLLAATLFFAVFDIQYAEIVLTLALLCYVLRQYKITILACAILCVRRGIDAVMLFQNNGTPVQIVWNAVSCAAFLIMTCTVLIAYTNARHAAKKNKK